MNSVTTVACQVDLELLGALPNSHIVCIVKIYLFASFDKSVQYLFLEFQAYRFPLEWQLI